MRAPSSTTRTRGRATTAAVVMSGLRQAARDQNRRVRRRTPGVASASVFQGGGGKPELKFLDLNTNISPTAASVAGVGPFLLNGCAQGSDAVQHIGRKTQMKSLYWIWQGSLAPTTAGTASQRLVIVYDKEAEGAAPTIAAVAQTDIFNADNILAMNNLNNRDRFITLVDEIVECTGTGGPQSFMRKGYRKIDLPVVFNAGAGATVASINTGSVYAVAWQDGKLITAAPLNSLQTRIRFTDN